MSTVQAARREIVPAPGEQHQAPDSPIARFRPNELHRLCRLRHDRILPADDEGLRIARRMVDALVLSGDAGRQQATNFLALWCPWLDRAAREEVVDEAFERPRYWSSSALGDDLNLTWAEREAARITTFRPAGVTDDEMAERRKAKAAERMREQRRKDTIHPEAELSLPALRAEAIALVLRPGERCTIVALCAELKRTRSIRFAHLKGRALSTAVHRAIEYGEGRGFFRKKVEPNASIASAWIENLRSAR